MRALDYDRICRDPAFSAANEGDASGEDSPGDWVAESSESVLAPSLAARMAPPGSGGASSTVVLTDDAGDATAVPCFDQRAAAHGCAKP